MAFSTVTGSGSVAIKESVYDKIVQSGANENSILNLIGSHPIKNTRTAWITDNIATPKKNAHLEIDDFTGDRVATKQKNSNVCQIAITEVMVSKTMQNVAQYGGQELAYQLGKSAKEHKNDLEYAFFGLERDSDVKKSVFKAPKDRTETKAGEMAGIFYFLAKGANSFSSGKRGNVIAFDDNGDWTGDETPLDWLKFNEMLEQVWQSGATPKDVFVGTKLKAAINAFAKDYRIINSGDKTWSPNVTRVDTDFGVVNIRIHRYLSDTYGLGDVMLAGDFQFMKHGLLIPTMVEDVPTSKTAVAKRFYTEHTLEVRNADAFVIGVGLK